MNGKHYLAVSLFANAVLAFLAFGPKDSPAPTKDLAQSQAVIEKSHLPSETVSSPQTNSNSTNTILLVKKFNWESVESPDYKQYIANLRSIGCPEETIRDIILADVNKLYDSKRKQLRGTPKKFEYWKAGNPFGMNLGNPETLEKIAALEQEKNDVLRELGIEPDFKSTMAGMMNPFEEMFDFLPDAKKTQIIKAMGDMQTKMAKSASGGQPDMEEIANAQKEMEKQLKEMLTPEEALDYDLRLSMTAMMMRSQVEGWNPDEQQFLEVFKLRKEFDDEYNPMTRGNETPEQRTQREAAEKELKEAIAEKLGPENYAKYERAQNWEFQQIMQAVKKAEMGVEEANRVFEMKQLAENEANRLRSNPELTAEQQAEALKAIRKETEESLQKVLGEKGWQTYNRGYNTHWLNNMAPSENPPNPVAAEAVP
ncbi:MAG: hypothetical protein SFY81_05475 [Verrucomicrobiota bacterium]|nr:hypothetical protein [Verrucomicrobiota bacterium]